jgi:hypothetical protein
MEKLLELKEWIEKNVFTQDPAAGETYEEIMNKINEMIGVNVEN